MEFKLHENGITPMVKTQLYVYDDNTFEVRPAFKVYLFLGCLLLGIPSVLLMLHYLYNNIKHLRASRSKWERQRDKWAKREETPPLRTPSDRDTRPRCQCGFQRGEWAVGQTCRICNTAVQNRIFEGDPNGSFLSTGRDKPIKDGDNHGFRHRAEGESLQPVRVVGDPDPWIAAQDQILGMSLRRESSKQIETGDKLQLNTVSGAYASNQKESNSRS